MARDCARLRRTSRDEDEPQAALQGFFQKISNIGRRLFGLIGYHTQSIAPLPVGPPQRVDVTVVGQGGYLFLFGKLIKRVNRLARVKVMQEIG